MVTGSPAAGHTVTKPPLPGAHTAGSVVIETSAAAIAASAALPPSSAMRAPAAAAMRELDATGTCVMLSTTKFQGLKRHLNPDGSRLVYSRILFQRFPTLSVASTPCPSSR